MPRHFERDEAGFRSGHGVGAQEFIGEDRETIDLHGFQSLIERSGLARGFDPRLYQPEIFVKDSAFSRCRSRSRTESLTNISGW